MRVSSRHPNSRKKLSPDWLLESTSLSACFFPVSKRLFRDFLKILSELRGLLDEKNDLPAPFADAGGFASIVGFGIRHSACAGQRNPPHCLQNWADARQKPFLFL